MINHEKAYILGLLVGGGIISGNTFVISLPFKKWGMELNNANKIQIDILTKICQKFNREYNFSVTYEIGNGLWLIKPIANPAIGNLLNDLSITGLPTSGFLLDNVNLELAQKVLQGVSIETFLSGIFDARASLTSSHRRFTNEAPVVSIEIPGSTKNFQFVIQLCGWLTSQGSITDQILFNHPCQHSASDPNYINWKKGFKIRFLVKSFIAKHSFALQAKAFDIRKLESIQTISQQPPCRERKIRKPSPVTIHSDINSDNLPKEVRNKLFFHYFHFCALLGCPYAPLEEVNEIVENYKNLVFVLPRLEKGSITKIINQYEIIHSEYYSSLQIETLHLSINDLLNFDHGKEYLELEQGIAYLFSEELHGKRHIGNKNLIISNNVDEFVTLLKVKNTDLYPIAVINNENDRAFIVSALSSSLNLELIDKKINVDGLNIEVIK